MNATAATIKNVSFKAPFGPTPPYWNFAGNGRKIAKAIKAPHPVNIPTNPAMRLVELAISDLASEAFLGCCRVEDLETNRAGVIVNSEAIEGVETWPLPSEDGATLPSAISGWVSRLELATAGRIAVTMVDAAAPPRLNSNLASRS